MAAPKKKESGECKPDPGNALLYCAVVLVASVVDAGVPGGGGCVAGHEKPRTREWRVTRAY